MTASSKSPAPSPTSTPLPPSPPNTSPKRFSTAALTAITGADPGTLPTQNDVGGVLKILAPRLDSTADPHVTATPLRVSPVPAPLRYLSHEGEGGTALHLDRIARMLGQHECRRVVRWTGTPPALPALIEPGPWIGLPGFEHRRRPRRTSISSRNISSCRPVFSVSLLSARTRARRWLRMTMTGTSVKPSLRAASNLSWPQ